MNLDKEMYELLEEALYEVSPFPSSASFMTGAYRYNYVDPPLMSCPAACFIQTFLDSPPSLPAARSLDECRPLHGQAPSHHHPHLHLVGGTLHVDRCEDV